MRAKPALILLVALLVFQLRLKRDELSKSEPSRLYRSARALFDAICAVPARQPRQLLADTSIWVRRLLECPSLELACGARDLFGHWRGSWAPTVCGAIIEISSFSRRISLNMFGRVAACGITAFFLVLPATSSGETNALVEVETPAASVVIATTQDQVKIQAQDQIRDQAHYDPPMQVKLAALDPAEPSKNSPTLAEPFGLKAVPVTSGELLTKWSGVEADIRSESDILARCRENSELCPSAARNFLDIVAEGRAHNGRARIGVINRAINLAISPMSDLAQWGMPDRWSAPLATLTTGRGDCEDYAIAKYVALRAAGIAADDVRLVIVRNLAVDEDHAVVAVRLDGSWIMLDNRWLALVEDVEMRRVVPLFVLDDDGVKQFSNSVAIGAIADISSGSSRRPY
jgi:predicted transglutaminase-like cysteine proteinase